MICACYLETATPNWSSVGGLKKSSKGIASRTLPTSIQRKGAPIPLPETIAWRYRFFFGQFFFFFFSFISRVNSFLVPSSIPFLRVQNLPWIMGRPQICPCVPIIPGMAGTLPILQAYPNLDTYLTQNPAIHAQSDSTKVVTDSKSNKLTNVKTIFEATKFL